jgi:hypothetical protein
LFLIENTNAREEYLFGLAMREHGGCLDHAKLAKALRVLAVGVHLAM